MKNVKKNLVRESIYSYIHSIEVGCVPPHVLERAKFLMLDAIGLMILASSDKRMDHVRKIGSALGEGEGAMVPFFPAKLSSASAAFVMSCYMQLHDFNDGHRLSAKRGGAPHPGRVIIPVAMAEAGCNQVSGNSVLTAIVAGYDVAVKVRGGRSLRPTNPQYAAATVAAKLRGFSISEISSALGYAGYLSASKFGTSLPRPEGNFLSKGIQAYTGVLAAHIAGTGQAGPKIDFNEKRMSPFTLGRDDEFEIVNVYVKPYPTCRMTHSAIEALKGAMDTLEISSEDIERITVRQLPAGMYVAKRRPTPTSSYKAAEFNLYYCLARYALDRELGVSQFTQEKIADPNAHRLIERISIIEDDELSSNYPKINRPAVVELTTKDGRSFENRIDLATGDEKSLTFDVVMEKFLKNCAGIIDEVHAKEIASMIMKLDELEDVSQLMMLLKHNG